MGAKESTMTARRRFMSLAAQHGIAVDYNRGTIGSYSLELTAPAGFIFRSSGSMFDCSMMGWDSDGKNAKWTMLVHELQGIIDAGFEKEEQQTCNQ